jgi:hypothetical protein
LPDGNFLEEAQHEGDDVRTICRPGQPPIEHGKECTSSRGRGDQRLVSPANPAIELILHLGPRLEVHPRSLEAVIDHRTADLVLAHLQGVEPTEAPVFPDHTVLVAGEERLTRRRHREEPDHGTRSGAKAPLSSSSKRR